MCPNPNYTNSADTKHEFKLIAKQLNLFMSSQDFET